MVVALPSVVDDDGGNDGAATGATDGSVGLSPSAGRVVLDDEAEHVEDLGSMATTPSVVLRRSSKDRVSSSSSADV